MLRREARCPFTLGFGFVYLQCLKSNKSIFAWYGDK